MNSPAHDSQATLAGARAALTRQRYAVRGPSIGRRSAAIKRRHRLRKLGRAAMAAVGVLVAAFAAGLVVDGIGVVGIMLTVVLMLAVAVLLLRYPRLELPSREELAGGDTRQVVGRTELWLEAQRPALPAPAVTLVDRIGSQLDALGAQLEGLPREEPAALEVRRLVGEDLPEMIASYTRIPSHLRGEARNGRTPDDQLVDGLGKVSQEIDTVTRQLAAGDLDRLAIRGRYLDYKYGSGPAAPGEGVS